VLSVRCVELCRQADLILHAGDLTSVTFLDQLRALGPPVEAVHGNMDEPALQVLLPLERIVEVAGARIGMVHIRDRRLRTRFPDCDAIVYGHTHMPEVALDESVWILNPGSPTERRRAPTRSMLVLEVESGAIEPRLVELT
jgi:putative phosphoesterase